MGRLSTFRQGDLCELLADYLLSGIGISTPIRRQDDTGFDFYCSISDQEHGVLTFGSPFVIQIKSKGRQSRGIKFGDKISQKWKAHKLEWLFRNEMPLFFGFVDQKNQSIEIHDCSSFGYTKNKREKFPAIVEFIPRKKNDLDSDIDKPKETVIQGWNNHDSNGLHCKVDIGFPIITLSYIDFQVNNLEQLRFKKNLFRQAIVIQSISILFFKQQLGYLNWIVKNKTNEFIFPGWAFFTWQDGTIHTINRNQEALISIALHAKINKKDDILKGIITLTKILEVQNIPKEIKDDHPEFFNL